MKKLYKITALLSITLMFGACGLIEKVDKDGKPINADNPQRVEDYDIGEFEGKPITYYELEREMSSVAFTLAVLYGQDFLLGDGKEVHDTLHHTMANKIIDDRVIDAKIMTLNIEFNESEAKASAQARFDKMKEQFGDKFEDALADMSHTKDTYLEYLEKDERRQAFYKAYKVGITVTDDEVKKQYDENKATYVKKAGTTIYHIYLGTVEAEALKNGEEIKTKMKAGATFSEMVQKYGTDYAAGDEGLIGYFDYDTTALHQDFMEHVKKMKEGEITGVVKSTAGYHIIRVEGVQNTDVQLEFDEVKEDIRKDLLNNKISTTYTEDMTKWKTEFTYDLYEDKLPVLKEQEGFDIKEDVETPVETPIETPAN